MGNGREAGILAPERQNSFRLLRGIAERLPLEDATADAVAWREEEEN